VSNASWLIHLLRAKKRMSEKTPSASTRKRESTYQIYLIDTHPGHGKINAIFLMIISLWILIPLPGRSTANAASNKSNVMTLVTQLQDCLDKAQLPLNFHPRWGYLPALLRILEIPATSQTLVFSKTSSQFRLISPRSPRALYFNDMIYVGWVPGGSFLEISVADPTSQRIFFTLEQRKTPVPRLIPDNGQCLQCHESSRTLGIPGHLTRSVYSRSDGQPHWGATTVNVDHTTPLAERLGGWYVTGTIGAMTHRGNSTIDDLKSISSLDTGLGASVTHLRGRFDVDAYLTPHSDIIAHLILAHQTQMHNHIAKAAVETRRALEYLQNSILLFGEASDQTRSLVRRLIERPSENLLRHMLFLDEASLQGMVHGTTSFAEEFQERGPRDHRGRSLRDLDLKTRIFRYPCSYLIYSEAFKSLPKEVKHYVYTRLFHVLTGYDQTNEFDHLSESDRRAIQEILIETLPEVRWYWTQMEP